MIFECSDNANHPRLLLLSAKKKRSVHKTLDLEEVVEEEEEAVVVGVAVCRWAAEMHETSLEVANTV